MKCEAAAMDAAYFENWTDPAAPCDEIAEVEARGYSLCRGCAEALEVLVGFGERMKEE